jgi:peroxiredoxin Q/BCP
MPVKSPPELNVGDAAPYFAIADDQGKTHSLKDYRGKSVILYFYPKDNTPGCTTEACDFRDNFSRLKSKGVVVLGVSPDSEKSHQNFKGKFELPFPLLVDSDKKLCQAYGVWKEKSMYGRKYMGVERTTLLIDAEGKIARVWRKVKVPGHAEEVLMAVKAL